MKKLSLLALAAFLLSMVPALATHAATTDISSCKDCSVGDPLGGRKHHKKAAPKPADGSTASTPASGGSAPKADAAPKPEGAAK